MVKRIVKSIYLVLTPLQKRLLRKVPWAKFGFLFLGGKICIFNIRDGEERERKKKFCSDWQYRQWLIDLLCFFPSFREARETFSQNFAFKNKCTLRYQVSSLLEAKVRLLFSSFAAAWPWSRRWWSYWNFATKLKRFPGKKNPHWSFSCGKPKTREFGNAMDFAWRHLESFAVCGISVLQY